MNKNNVLKNFFWKFLERCGAQVVTFIVTIILARLLDPTAYGTISIVTVSTALLQVFVNSGFGTALIQKKNSDDVDFSSVFYFNIVLSIILYLFLFLCAQLISNFYNMPTLKAMVRVLGLVIIVYAIKNVQQAYVSKTMQFKRFFFATLGGTVLGAVVGITMAYNGCGVWSLVGQILTNEISNTLILWITVRWRPKLVFSFSRLKVMFSFGWKLLASSLLDTLYNDLRTLIIGKLYYSYDLAFYNKGKQFPNLIVTNVNNSIDSVLLPTLSSVQDSIDTVKTLTRRAIMVSTYIMMPLMVGLAVCAKPLVLLLLTEKWLPCVPFMRIFCITLAFYPIHTANLNAIKAMGRSDLFLKLEIAKKAIGLISIFITMWISVKAMAYSLLITTFISQIINSWPNKKLLNYGYKNQIMDMLPQILISIVMGIMVFIIEFLGFSNIITLLMQVFVGAISYIGMSAIFKLESFSYLLSIFKKGIK